MSEFSDFSWRDSEIGKGCALISCDIAHASWYSFMIQARPVPSQQMQGRRMLEDRIAKLSDVQKQCLRLAASGRSSKEIAPEVGLSHQTVDQYIHRARVTLGAENRRDAARILMDAESAQPFKQFELKPSRLDDPQNSAIVDLPAAEPVTLVERIGLPPIGGKTNDLTVQQRLYAIARIAFFLMITATAIIIISKGAFVVLS
tara:strand:- start:686 stop:1291 length:606 start_codon:yes stop_codon:yes gene_type:complete